MSVKFIAVKCPSCGAELPMEEGRKEMYCSYCGSKIMMVNENEHIYHHIDEAEIKHAETERMVELKKLELLEKRQNSISRRRKFKIILSLILGASGIISIVIGHAADKSWGFSIGMLLLLITMYIWIFSLNNASEEDVMLYSGNILKIPRAISNYTEQNYTSVEAIFRKAGFTNIRCVALEDLKLGLLKKPGNVESITVNGRTITTGGGKFPSDSTVVISYHSMSVS